MFLGDKSLVHLTSDLDEGQRAPGRFADGTELGGAADTPEAALPFSESWAGWRVGQGGTQWSWGCAAGGQLCGEGPGSSGGQQVAHGPAVCPGGQGGQRDPGGNWEECGQQVEGGDPALCSALVRHIWGAGSSAGLPSSKETGSCWGGASAGL